MHEDFGFLADDVIFDDIMITDTMNSFGTSLDDVEFAVNTIERPLHIHSAAIVLFDNHTPLS